GGAAGRWRLSRTLDRGGSGSAVPIPDAVEWAGGPGDPGTRRTPLMRSLRRGLPFAGRGLSAVPQFAGRQLLPLGPLGFRQPSRSLQGGARGPEGFGDGRAGGLLARVFPANRSTSMKSFPIVLLLQASVATAGAGTEAEADQAADRGGLPERGGPKILPEAFLRGFDPITAYFAADVGPSAGSADDGARILKIEPTWPGAYVWADRRTLQFRPAEPWPPLSRFSLEAR